MEQLKTFDEYTFDVQNQIYDILINAGEADPAYLKVGLQRAYTIGCIFIDGKVIATASLKVPLHSYVEKIEKGSGSQKLYVQQLLELGYVCVLPGFQGNKVIYPLLEKLLAINRPLLSTTKVENIPMIKILSRYGFVKAGTPYRSDRRETFLQVFIREGN